MGPARNESGTNGAQAMCDIGAGEERKSIVFAFVANVDSDSFALDLLYESASIHALSETPSNA